MKLTKTGKGTAVSSWHCAYVSVSSHTDFVRVKSLDRIL
jgi:hypothetical protein